MNKVIEALTKKREQSRDSYNRVAASIQDELQEALNKVFDESKELAEAVAELENSTDYSTDEAGEVYRFVRFDVPTQFKEYKDELNNWFSEAHCVHLDIRHDALMSFCGECIIVNEDGDVFMNHDVIIDVDEYKNEDGELDESKRNQLIEQYMEKSGYFPEVFSQDRYGNLFLINTKENQ